LIKLKLFPDKYDLFYQTDQFFIEEFQINGWIKYSNNIDVKKTFVKFNYYSYKMNS